MDWTVLIVVSAAGLNAAGAVLAWYAKIQWSKEFAAAKDETIAAKDAEIGALKTQLRLLEDMMSPKVREFRDIQKAELEGFVELLQSQMRTAGNLAAEKDQLITTLAADAERRASEAARFRAERDDLQQKSAELSSKVEDLNAALATADQRKQSAVVEDVITSSASLAHSIASSSAPRDDDEASAAAAFAALPVFRDESAMKRLGELIRDTQKGLPRLAIPPATLALMKAFAEEHNRSSQLLLTYARTVGLVAAARRDAVRENPDSQVDSQDDGRERNAPDVGGKKP